MPDLIPSQTVMGPNPPPDAEALNAVQQRPRRVGRPPRTEPVKVVSLSIAVSFYKALREEAKLSGMHPASYILARLMQTLPPRVVPELSISQWDGLRHLLDDLTSEFRRANEAELVPDSVAAKMANVTEEIRRLRLTLLGVKVEE